MLLGEVVLSPQAFTGTREAVAGLVGAVGNPGCSQALLSGSRVCPGWVCILTLPCWHPALVSILLFLLWA